MIWRKRTSDLPARRESTTQLAGKFPPNRKRRQNTFEKKENGRKIAVIDLI
jgi:hypothetical protein